MKYEVASVYTEVPEMILVLMAYSDLRHILILGTSAQKTISLQVSLGARRNLRHEGWQTMVFQSL